MALALRNGTAIQDIFLRDGRQVENVYNRLGNNLYSRPELPQISSFRSNPAHLLASVTGVANISLSWTVSNTISITIRNSSGTAIHTSTDDIGMVSIATPANDTFWTLEASNAEGTTTSRWNFYRSVEPVITLLTSRITQSVQNGITTVSVQLSCRIRSHPWLLTRISVSPELYGATSSQADRFFRYRTGDVQREGVVAQLHRVVRPEIIGTQTTYRVEATNSLTGTSGSASHTIIW